MSLESPQLLLLLLLLIAELPTPFSANFRGRWTGNSEGRLQQLGRGLRRRKISSGFPPTHFPGPGC